MPLNNLNENRHILCGTDELIGKQLGNHKHGTVGKRLNKAPLNFNPRKLLEAMIAEIENNLERAWKLSRRQPPEVVLGKSAQNWRQMRPTKEHDKRKPEREFEHRLADAGKNDEDWIWWNQMPIASGLVGHRADRTRAIDLVCKQRKAGTSYHRFIELKINRNAGAPLAALMEILRYGLVYFVLRKNQRAEWLKDTSLDSLIFKANHIDLCVLAPRSYYKDYQLAWLEKSLTSALNEIFDDLLGDGELEMNLSSYWPGPLETWDMKDKNFFQNLLKNDNDLKSILKDWKPAFPD